jgi:hypothetical protein
MEKERTGIFMDNIKHYKLVSGIDIITEEMVQDDKIAWIVPMIPQVQPPTHPGGRPTLTFIPFNILSQQQNFIDINRNAILCELQITPMLANGYKDMVQDYKAVKSGIIKAPSGLILPK